MEILLALMRFHCGNTSGIDEILLMEILLQEEKEGNSRTCRDVDVV
jgi:hypothetical protein